MIYPFISSLALAVFLFIASPALAADSAQGMAPMHVLGIELLLLIPLAGLALYLKTKKRSVSMEKKPDSITVSEPTRIANGGKAQILTHGSTQFLVIHSRNGAAQMVLITPSQRLDQTPTP